MSTSQLDLIKPIANGNGLSTDAHQMHRRAEARRRELKQTAPDLVNIVICEIRAALHSMRIIVHLLLEDQVTDPQIRREFLTIVDKKSEWLVDLVNGKFGATILESDVIPSFLVQSPDKRTSHRGTNHERSLGQPPMSRRNTDETESLSPRQMEVLTLMVRGDTNSDIAKCVGLKERTVKNYITAILRKLNAANRTHAAVLALRHGLVKV